MGKTIEDSVIRDIRAQLYQGLAEIEALLPPGTESEIQINQDQTNPKKAVYIVDISLKSSLGNFKVRISGTDVFQTVHEAKNKMVKNIENLYQLTQSTSARSDFVDSLIHGPWLH